MVLLLPDFHFELPSVLWRCWLGGRKGIRPVKNWVVGCWRGCLGWGTDLHIAQQMPLPLTISCSSKSRLVLTFLVLPFWCLLTLVVLDKFQKSSKTVVCVYVSFWADFSHPLLDFLISTLHDWSLLVTTYSLMLDHDPGTVYQKIQSASSDCFSVLLKTEIPFILTIVLWHVKKT